MTTIQLNFGLVAKVDGDFVFIDGNTFANKDRLKAMGAKWVPEKKSWMMSADTDLTPLHLPVPAVAVGGCGAAATVAVPVITGPKKLIKGLSVTCENGQISLSGKTLPLRDQLKARGGRWDPVRQNWSLPAGVSLDFEAPPPAPKPKPRAEWTREEWQAWISVYKSRNGGRVERCCEHAVYVGDLYGPSEYNCPRHGETRGSYRGD